MADIKRSIEYNESQSKLIKEKLNDPKFSYGNWSDDDLAALRKSIRDFYRHVQNAICSYCKKIVSLRSTGNCHIEHIVPKSKYKKFIFEPKNLCVICADCSEIKRDQETLNEQTDPLVKGDNRKIYPRTSSAFKIVHPHFDNYDEHILILGEKYYLDLSSKGSYTIYSCRLNRRLHIFGWDREIVEDSEIMELMSKYLEEANSIKRSQILSAFKKMLLQI